MPGRWPQAADLAAARDRLSEDDRQRKVHRRFAQKRGISVRRGPDRRRHRGAEGAIHATLRTIEQPEPKQPEPDPAGEQPAFGNGARSSSTSFAARRTARPVFPCGKCAGNWGLKSRSRHSRATPPRFANPTNKTLASCGVVIVFYGSWRRGMETHDRQRIEEDGGLSRCQAPACRGDLPGRAANGRQAGHDRHGGTRPDRRIGKSRGAAR